ncbi:hypothetical protein JMUB7527_28400 [Staphylococcus aureus]
MHILNLYFMVVFFQAEDGIRDLRMSRGLGDVYKRQDILTIQELLAHSSPEMTLRYAKLPVSYTHLTLPTICSV